MSKENTFPRNGGSGFVGHGRHNYLKDEELIVRRRNAESDRQQLWSGVNDYFKTWDVRVNKFSNWVSPLYYNHVCDARSAGIQIQAKLENLEKRRQKLSHLLTKEATEYEEEMKVMRKHHKLSPNMKLDDRNLCYMNLEFLRRADQVTKRENELKLYHHYTFPHPDKFRKQYAYFSRRAANEGNKEECSSKLFGPNKKTDSVITNEKTDADKKMIQSHIIALKMEIDHRIKKLDDLEEKKTSLKSKENRRNELISQIKSRFNELFKEDETDDRVKDNGKCYEEDKIKNLSGLSPSASYLLLWREKSKSVQDILKQQIRFLDIVIEVADTVKEFMFKYQVEKMKNLFFKKLQIESGREKLSNLFECTYQEPRMWWKEENKMWIEDEDERKKHLKNVFSKLETMEEKWNLNNLEEQKCILENQEIIIAELEKLQKDVENNENLLK